MGAIEHLAEVRERKRVAAEKYAQALVALVKKIFLEQYRPKLQYVLTGMCVDYSEQSRSVTVIVDAESAKYAGQTVIARASWNVSKAAIVKHRVKLLSIALDDQTDDFVLGAIISE